MASGTTAHDATRTMAGTSVASGAGAASAGAGAGAAHRPRPSARRRALLFVPALLVLATIAYLIFGLRDRGGKAEAAERSIAVLSFQNMQNPADPNREAFMATSLLNVALGESQVMPVVGSQRVQDVLRQMGRADRPLSGADALEAGRRAGATYVVTGYVYQTHPDVVLAAEVASTANGSVLTSRRVRVPGGEQGLFAGVDSLTRALRDGLAAAGFGVRDRQVDIAGLTTRNPAAYRAYVAGLDRFYRNDMGDAAEGFRAAVAADSTFALAWYQMAVARWWLHDNAGADRAVAAALRLGSRLATRDRDALRALSSLIGGDFNRAAEEYSGLIRLHPDDKSLYYGLGEALYHSENDLPGAREALYRAVALDSTFAVAYAHIIDVDVLLEDLPRARADAQRLGRADPTNPYAKALELSALGRLGDAPGALQLSREILAKYPGEDEAEVRHFVLLAAMGEADSARFLLERAVASGARVHPAAMAVARAILAVSEGRYRDVERETRPALLWVNAPGSDMVVGVLENRVRALFQLGRTEEALKIARLERDTIRRLFPVGSDLGQMIIVRHSLRAGQIQEARAALRAFERSMARQDTQNNRNARDYMTALIDLAEGRPREAARLLETARPIAPPFARVAQRRYSLAQALLAMGERDRAVPELQAVIARAPYAGDSEMLYQATLLLAKEYERLGRGDEALAMYRKIVHQYRRADPGLALKNDAAAAVARMEQRAAQRSAN